MPWPDDLRAGLVALLDGWLSRKVATRLRDREVRVAAMLLPANDSTWATAGELLREANALQRAIRPETDSAVRAALRRAADHARLPGSRKQFARILAANDDG